MTNNLRKLRKDKRYSLKELSEKMNFSYSTLNKLELGTQNMYVDQAMLLADFFNVSLDELCNRDFVSPNTTVYKTIEFDLVDIYKKLNTYSKDELIQLRGAIDFIIETKYPTNVNNQKIKDAIDSKL